MSGFSEGWLEVREPVDARSRDTGLVDLLSAWLGDRSQVVITDLGCGSGAGFRWLAPRLAVAQRWRCVDADRLLLTALTRRVGVWAGAIGWRCETRDATLELIDGTQRIHRLDTMRQDLASADLQTVLGSCNLLSASALIDLVSEVWLRRLVEACRHSGCAVLLALSYDGRLSFAPRHADDTLLRDRFNQHQRRDKSLGPALGPAAAAIAAGLFADAGYRVFEAASDWRLTSEDRPLLAPLLAGWMDAVTEQDAAAGRSLAAWQRTRGDQIRCGGLAVTVGHRDLLALPS